MDRIETLQDKISFLYLMDYSHDEIEAHVANGTAELLADIEGGPEGLFYVSPPHGGWILKDGDEVVAIHGDRDRAYREADRWGGDITFDLFATPDHKWGWNADRTAYVYRKEI